MKRELMLGLSLIGIIIGLMIAVISPALQTKFELSYIMDWVMWTGVGIMGLSALAYMVGAFLDCKGEE